MNGVSADTQNTVQKETSNRDGSERAEPQISPLSAPEFSVSQPTGEQLPWYAIQTRYRFERRAVVQLSRKGLETFLPVLEEIHRWSDRNKRVQTPLFSGYGFVQLALTDNARIKVLQTEGVIGFVAVRGEAVSIPAPQIEALRRLLSRSVPCALHPFLKSGQKVRIRGGCLDGIEGIFEQSRRDSMIISVEAIQRAVAIRIDGYDLELI